MNVLHVSNSISGGAGQAAYRLHASLLKEGIGSKFLVLGNGNNDDIYHIPVLGHISKMEKLYKYINGYKKAKIYPYSKYKNIYQLFSDHYSLYSITKHEAFKNADIINLHWSMGFINYPEVINNRHGKKLVWTLHDMNPFTGGCHYDAGCGRFETGCQTCPQLTGINVEPDLASKIWIQKRKLYNSLDNERMSIICPSKWMSRMVAKSPLGQFKSRIIPNGIDCDLYKPFDKYIARERISVHKDTKIVLFVAGNTQNIRKGYGYLIEALRRIRHIKDLLLVTVGENTYAGRVDVPNIQLGLVNDESLMSLIYSAADVLVLPTEQDNLPNTLIEAMACALPVIGFDVGGVGEIIDHAVSGKLVKFGDIDCLAKEIDLMLADTELALRMGKNGRMRATKLFSQQKQAKDYLEHYYREIVRH